MEDDDLGATGGGDPRAAIEGADFRGELPAGRLEMPYRPIEAVTNRNPR